MYVYGPMHAHGAQSVNAPHHQAAPTPPEVNRSDVSDQLDISPEAEMLIRARELPEIRAERVAQIRAAIAAGTYETPDKLEIAINRLLDEIA